MRSKLTLASTLAAGTALAACAALAAAAPASEAGAAAVSKAVPRVPCLSGTLDRAIGRVTPRTCILSLDGTPAPPLAAVAQLRRLRWPTYTRARAVARGRWPANHAPFDPIAVTAVFTRPVSTPCFRQFTRVTLVARDGTRRTARLPSACAPSPRPLPYT